MLGEKLGMISKSRKQDDNTEEQAIPQWKKSLLQKPSVSVRNGIAWVRLLAVKRLGLWRLSRLFNLPTIH